MRGSVEPGAEDQILPDSAQNARRQFVLRIAAARHHEGANAPGDARLMARGICTEFVNRIAYHRDGQRIPQYSGMVEELMCRTA